MILVDSNVWAYSANGAYKDQPIVAAKLAELIERGTVLGHPFVYGELLLGQGGPKRQAIIKAYPDLPMVDKLTDEAVWHFIRTHRIDNKGVTLVDAYLLTATHVAGAQLWTEDKALKALAVSLKVAYEPEVH